MKPRSSDLIKEHYQQLRLASCEHLWTIEVPQFNRSSGLERLAKVSVVRAVGVVFSESGTAEQKKQAREWLLSLLNDSEEKIRRYAVAALPKVGSGESEEAELLNLLKINHSERETKILAKTLEKIGGTATLSLQAKGEFEALASTAQKLQANVARTESPSVAQFENVLRSVAGIQINLRCRSGLEALVKQELEGIPVHHSKFRVLRSFAETVTVVPTHPFSLGDLYQFRTFSTASFILGTVDSPKDQVPLDAFATIIASPRTQQLLETFTEGPVRYRLEFFFKAGPRNSVRPLADKVFQLAPKLLNDSRHAPWEINVYRIPRGYSVELTPKLRPDPRFSYRQGDVPAASHPPLAACLAKLAGPHEQETVWDPFCGSGLELIERTYLGGVKHLFGTDLSAEAIQTSKANLSAAFPEPPPHTFVSCDFREYHRIKNLRNISLVISNPPLGRRVPIPNLSELIEELFQAASEVLKPGGRLIFVNPLTIKPKDPSLKLIFKQKVDLGCFHCYVEKYEKKTATLSTSAEQTSIPFRKAANRKHY